MVIDTSALLAILQDEPEPLLYKGADFPKTDVERFSHDEPPVRKPSRGKAQ